MVDEVDHCQGDLIFSWGWGGGWGGGMCGAQGMMHTIKLYGKSA